VLGKSIREVEDGKRGRGGEREGMEGLTVHRLLRWDNVVSEILLVLLPLQSLAKVVSIHHATIIIHEVK
jgi:hypothetical protein